MIHNITKQIILDEAHPTYCFSGIKKLIGMMFLLRYKRPYVFGLEPEHKLTWHMFFVFFPIDLLFLDEEKKVIEIKRNFKPFTIYKQKWPARYCIELRENSTCSTEIGDVILD